MGKIANWFFRETEERVLDPDIFMDMAAERKTATGKNVTPSVALEGTVAVYACVSLISETVGSLPCLVYRRNGDERERVRTNESTTAPRRWPGSVQRMLHESPNPEMTAQEYWELAKAHSLLWGNHYSFIERDGSGRPNALWPLRPDQMTVSRAENSRGLPVGATFYSYRLPNGEERGLNRYNILHIKEMGVDGVVGLSRIEHARQAIATEQAAGEYAGKFFANSATPSGILVTDGSLSPEKARLLKEQWQANVGGLSRAQSVAVLHSGLDYKTIGIPPKDAEFIELRRFQIEEIARLFRAPLHLIGDTSKATTWGSGIEQMTIGFVVYTLRSHLKRIELAINRDLGDAQAGKTLLDENLFVEFSVEGLLRGDSKSRSEFYSSGIQNGWLTRADVRKLENLAPVEGLEKPFVPLNMGMLGADGEIEKPEPEPEPEPPEQPEPGPEDEEDNIRDFERAYRDHLKEMANGTKG